MQNDLEIADSFLSPLFGEIFVVKERDFSIEYNPLGKGAQKILMLVNQKEAEYLDSEQLQLLKGVVEKGLRRSMDDVWVVNLDKFPSKKIEDILIHFEPAQLIAWGMEQWLSTQALSIPVHRHGLFQGVEILQAMALKDYISQPNQKSKLWAAMQKMFFN